MKNLNNSNDGVTLFGVVLNLQLIVVAIVVLSVGVGIGLIFGKGGQKTETMSEPVQTTTSPTTDGGNPGDKKVETPAEVVTLPALKSDDPMGDGKAAFNKQNYALALKYFELALSHADTKAEGYHWRGIVYACSQLPDSAVKEYDQAVSLLPDSAPIHLDRAAAYYDMREFAKAVEDYDVILRGEPKNSDALFGRALANYALANSSAALSDLNAVNSISPTARSYELLGDVFCSAKDFQRALNSYSQGLNIAPKDYELRARQARAYLLSGRAKEALNRFGALRKEKSGRGDIRNDEGYAELYLGDYYQALQSFKLASDRWSGSVVQANLKYAANKLVAQSLSNIRRGRNLASNYARLAYGYLCLRDFESAERSATQAVNLNSRDKHSWYILGRCQYEAHQFAKAYESCSRAVALDPSYSSAVFEMALAASANRQFQLAVDTWQAYHRLDRDSIAYSNESHDYMEMDRYDEAERAAKMALEIDSASPNAMFALSKIYEKRGDTTEALSWFNRALAESPQDASLYQGRGLVYFQANECDLALRDEHKALELDPTEKYARYSLQMILMVVGTPDELLKEAKIGATDFEPNDRDYLFAASMFPLYAFTLAGDSARGQTYMQDGLAKQTRGTKWPVVLAECFAGQKTREECLAACVDNGERTEAHTWFGVSLLQKGEKQKAMEDFKWVAENGNPLYLEASLAKALLARNTDPLPTNETVSKAK